MNKFISIVLVSSVSLILNAQNPVKWMLTGALTPTSVDVRAKLTNPSGNVRGVVATSNTFSAPFIFTHVATVSDSLNGNVAALSVTGLQPDTRYYFRIEADGTIDTTANGLGTFKTPADGPSSFTFMAGTCNREPNTNTYNDFPSFNPLFYMNVGDLHYVDPCDVDVTYHRSAYEDDVFNRPKQAAMFRNIPFVYMWDDHDYCGNDASGSNLPGTAAARRAYQEFIPHYPLALGSGNVPIYQSFTIGRVRFLLTDVRSAVEQGSAMGAAQKNWFKNELIQARNNKQLICWVSSYSWYGFLNDNWGGYTAERTELSEFFRDSAITNMFIINGDAHMLAMDNGSNGDFTAAKNNPYRYPLLQCGPIENTGSFKGGSYSECLEFQFFVKTAQYAAVTVTDNGGDEICITFDGFRKSLSDQTTEKVCTYNFCRNIETPTGINELNNTNGNWVVFPNPTTTEVYFQNKANRTLPFTMYTADGKAIYEGACNANSIQPIQISQLSAGVYTIVTRGESGLESRKLVINR